MTVKSSAHDDMISTVGRFAAGEDPAKREQILEGAKRVFMKLGFDAASMNDITREAGVSKGTIYVYFNGKDDLFQAMMEDERAAFVASMRTALEEQDDIEASLYSFGIHYIKHTTSEKVITAMRTVLGVRDRMPDLCQRFFNGPENLRTILRGFLDNHVTDGKLQIEDMDLAARQFLELAGGTFFKFRLFGGMETPPSQDEMERVIRGAIRVFMAAYGTKST